MKILDVVLFSPGRDERIASVGVVLGSRGDAALLWIPIYNPQTGGLRPWGTVALVPMTDFLEVLPPDRRLRKRRP